MRERRGRCKGAFGSGKGRACPMSCMFAVPLLRHVELAADLEAFRLAVFAAPDCDPALAVDLAICADREDSVGLGPVFFAVSFVSVVVVITGSLGSPADRYAVK